MEAAYQNRLTAGQWTNTDAGWRITCHASCFAILDRFIAAGTWHQGSLAITNAPSHALRVEISTRSATPFSHDSDSQLSLTSNVSLENKK